MNENQAHVSIATQPVPANNPKMTFYYAAVIGLGALVCAVCLVRLPPDSLDKRFVMIAALTLACAAQTTIRIPGFSAHLSLSDALTFTALLLFDGEAAVLLAAAEGACSSLRFSRKSRTIVANAGASACSMFLTVWLLRSVFGSAQIIAEGTTPARFFAGVCVLGLAQYLFNTGIVAVGGAIKTEQSYWRTWRTCYLWTSISYFSSALLAAAIVRLIAAHGFYTALTATPVIAIIYFTYRTYLKTVEVSSAQAKQAERHVAELSSHIAEQERISRELEESREHFRRAAYHDALTGLPNRAYIKEELRRAIDRAQNPDGEATAFALLFLDLDRFKVINDSLGHAAGDHLLCEIAARLKTHVRPTDVVARLGGDEFAILLEGLRNWDEATCVAERVLRDVMRPVNLDGHQFYTTASIGIARSEIAYDKPEDVLRDADAAMYRAKESGKACYALFDQEMHRRAVALLETENDLRRAVERGEFVLDFQPIFSLANEQVSGFEALIRWRHPRRGLIAPSEFIALAEETGLIVEIGAWALGEACRNLRCWQERTSAARALTISVNLSSRQFMQPDLVEQVRRTLWETNLDPRSLRLEITESSVMVNAAASAEALEQLRAIGVRLSIDDFGTGYSCLSYLHRFPVTTLKIDRSFVTRMGKGEENLAIVRTIKALADNLNMETVAEGVESAEQLALLRELGCQQAQGYLLGKPLDAQEALALVGTLPPRDLAPAGVLHGRFDARLSRSAARLCM